MHLQLRTGSRIGLGIAACALFAAAMCAQPLTPEEAERIYREATPPLAPGCYKQVQGNETTYEQVLADGKHYTRTETRLRRDGVWILRVQMCNAEGTWRLYDQVALLEPSVDGAAAKKELTEQFPGADKMIAQMERDAKTEQEKFAKLSPEERKRAEAAMRLLWSGQRTVAADGTPRIAVRQKLSPEMIKRVQDCFALMVKQVPFLFRPLVKPFIAKIPDKFPCETEWIIDPTKNRILLTRTYTSAGVLLQETPTAEWQPCEPGDLFNIPPTFRQLRPKGRFEAARLESKYQDEQIQSVKKAHEAKP